MMASRKGLTILEMVLVLVILGVIVTVAIISYYNSIWQSKVQGVENNLRAIVAAQQKFYEDYNSECANASNSYNCTGYCINSSVTTYPANPPNLTTANCGDSQSDLNVNLGLNMASVNDGFNYSCVAATPPSGITCPSGNNSSCTFTCTATNSTTSLPANQINQVTIDISGNLTCYNTSNPNSSIPCPTSS